MEGESISSGRGSQEYLSKRFLFSGKRKKVNVDCRKVQVGSKFHGTSLGKDQTDKLKEASAYRNGVLGFALLPNQDSA